MRSLLALISLFCIVQVRCSRSIASDLIAVQNSLVSSKGNTTLFQDGIKKFQDEMDATHEPALVALLADIATEGLDVTAIDLLLTTFTTTVQNFTSSMNRELNRLILLQNRLENDLDAPNSLPKDITDINEKWGTIDATFIEGIDTISTAYENFALATKELVGNKPPLSSQVQETLGDTKFNLLLKLLELEGVSKTTKIAIDEMIVATEKYLLNFQRL